ncbi:uncharacterized protein Z519_03696 [Cladophialophora bantiana CBS 173.52]|uniref:Mur ligase central domain-containing protein n=1 Tax=Cladophialophora bantiana (strain ATCC 10958 / CBS 173.52 / CDC B-1940 / NIH 8579) TaxID=1442370 RepID=A0A0D2G942_CLAB1|nr:uncharacterized protein Z519_03696 [Cladophialophora bantiana CBS 173.52]KIW95112.1 hypothetical protein Z519_03696 [Cladophialophora bantiana CBS 173.52]
MINLGLQRITQLLNPLFSTHPTLPWKAVHIAGTNGKGSVAAMVSTFLGHLGYKVGRFTSPHLIDRWDGITLNKVVVEPDRFLRVEQDFRQRSIDEDINASEFEILTATAFQLFTDEEVDVAVIECGLGGRLDATNVLRPKDVVVSVLTKVGLDHTDFLGDSLEAITREKVGIFKLGVPVVLDQTNQRSVIDVAENRLKELGWGENGAEGVYVSVEERRHEFDEAIWDMGLSKHSGQNLYLAYSCFRKAEERLAAFYGDRPHHARREPPPSSDSPRPNAQPSGDSLVAADVRPSEAVRESLAVLVEQAVMSLPGRLQWLTLPPILLPENLQDMTARLQNDRIDAKVLLDGAHNSIGAAALAGYVKTQLRLSKPDPRTKPQPKDPLPVTWLLSVKSDKNADEILERLLQPTDNVVTCSFGSVDGMPWVKSMGAIELAEIARRYTSGVVEALCDEYVETLIGHGDQPTPDEKMRIIIRQAVSVASRASEDDSSLRLCITGSLYLVGDVLRCIQNSGGSITDECLPPV